MITHDHISSFLSTKITNSAVHAKLETKGRLKNMKIASHTENWSGSTNKKK